MKFVTRIALTGLVLGIVSMTNASAMVPHYDIEQNNFPDVGAAARVLTDIDNGAWHLRERLESGLSDYSLELKPPSRVELDLLGKHII